jgi:plastocyanin
MGRRRFVATMTVGVVVTWVVAAMTFSAGASGGGGCGRPVTDHVGTRVVIRNFCFGPTVLRVRKGQTVTFANRDTFAHVVLGANATWGSFNIVRGRHDVQYRFTRPGVYPYVCTYHPGMVGAVVVGGGVPHTASRTTTAAGPAVRVASKPEARSVNQAGAPASVPSDGGTSPWDDVTAGAIAIAVLLLGVAGQARRRTRLAAA